MFVEAGQIEDGAVQDTVAVQLLVLLVLDDRVADFVVRWVRFFRSLGRCVYRLLEADAKKMEQLLSQFV